MATADEIRRTWDTWPAEKAIAMKLIDALKKLDPEYVNCLKEAIQRFLGGAEELDFMLTYGIPQAGWETFDPYEDGLHPPLPATEAHKAFVAAIPAEEMETIQNAADSSTINRFLNLTVLIVLKENASGDRSH